MCVYVYVCVCLCLCVCVCVCVCTEGEEAVRPYTPISRNDLKGSFDLLVKICKCNPTP